MTKIFLAQMKPVLFDKIKNLEKIKFYIINASNKGADLVLFPELVLTGYFTRDKTFALAEDMDGESIQTIRELAKKYNIKVIFGFPEKKDGHVYNSACFINNTGEILGTYQKNHLWDEEYKYFSAGNCYPVWDTDIGKIGIMICYDTEFPESARILALKGAEMILAPTANMSPLEHLQRVLIQSRAVENQIFVATTNRIGNEESTYFFGESAAANPHGEFIFLADSSETGQIVEFDLSKISEVKRHYNYLGDRRPQTYSELQIPQN